MATIEPYPGTQSVLRAIALLKAFSDVQPDLNLSDLSRAAGLKKTTAYRLLTALESEGMVARDPGSETYHLGPEILVLGGMALRSNDLRSASRVELERLAQATGETATLEILVDGEVLILDEVLGSHLLGTTPSIGTRWPVQFTSTGKVLLAHLTQEERRAILQKVNAGLPHETRVQIDLLEDEFERIARQGYATAIEELEAGFVAAGAPVQNLSGKVTAAISLGGPGNRLTPQRLSEIIPLIQESASRISAKLGYRP